MIPQLIIISLGLIGLGINIGKHGQQKKNNTYDGWVQLVVLAITWSILYWGGFFDVFFK